MTSFSVLEESSFTRTRALRVDFFRARPVLRLNNGKSRGERIKCRSEFVVGPRNKRIVCVSNIKYRSIDFSATERPSGEYRTLPPRMKFQDIDHFAERNSAKPRAKCDSNSYRKHTTSQERFISE